jgi:Tol biopolymer transport system component
MLTYSGSDGQPACSPDGRTIAFVSARSGVSRIWLKQLSGGDEVALTDGEDTNPRFSSDGSQVLFTRNEGPIFSLWRIPLVGGQARRLIEDATEGVGSPDGAQLAFARTRAAGETRGELWLAGADGSNARLLYSGNAPLQELSWSLDGRELIGSPVVLANPQRELMVIPIAGGEPRRVLLSSGGSQITNPVWLGSGDRIAYGIVEALATTVTGQATRFVEHSLGTGRIRALLNLPSPCTAFEVLGEGQLVLALAQQSQNLLLVENPGTPAAGQRWLTRGGAADRQPVFSPDGRRVLFSSNRSGNLDLWEMDLESGALARVTDDAAQDWDPAYTPDGRGILWSTNRSGVFEVWMAAADGSGARQLSRDSTDAENPTMTPDGEWIVYVSARPRQPGVWKMRADGTEAALLAAGFSIAEVSPDGRYVASPVGRLGTTGTSLHVLRLADGKPLPWELPLSARSGPALGRPRWAGVDRLAYIDRDAAGRYGVTVRDIGEHAVGPARALAGFDPLAPTESFGLSPDGSRLVLSIQTSVSSLALAESVAGVDGARKATP